ncbi:LAFE_0G19152g1_1 [Lachancea fermentati]|uniref:LAFE_0G19152g1_1 n=1 Tax=Lachancea fermentati TaxID=4955 RepID=A0A1G4MIZ0_LACFM|nr:LAFE_0G19152g1_1 [Lachancea fermentati]
MIKDMRTIGTFLPIRQMAFNLTKLRKKCQNSNYQMAVNMSLVFLGCTFDLLNVAGIISVIEDLESMYDLKYTQASWALTSYAITFAGFIAFMGRLGDIVGNSVLFTFSCFFFTLFSLLCAVVNNFAVFAVFRALQGISAAGIVPCGYALIPILAHPNEVQKFFSIVSCGFSSTIGLGLIIGGAFALTNIGHKGIFYLTFAGMFIVSFAALLFTYKIESEQFIGQGKSLEDQTVPIIDDGPKLASLDFLGSFIFIAGSILIVVGLTKGGDSWKKPVAYVPFAIGVILFLGFFIWNCYYMKIIKVLSLFGVERTSYFDKVEVLIPEKVLFMKNFIPIVFGFACNNACLFSCIYIIDQYSQYVEKNSPLLAGVKLVPLIVIMVGGNALCALKSVKLRPRIGVAVGFFSMFAGCIILIQIRHIQDKLYWKILFCAQILVGFGASIFYPYGLKLVVGDAPSDSKGIASGITQTFGQLGIELTFSVMVSVLGNITEVLGKPNSVQTFRDGFQKCTYFTLAVATLGFILMTFFLREDHKLANDLESELVSSVELQEHEKLDSKAKNSNDGN